MEPLPFTVRRITIEESRALRQQVLRPHETLEQLAAGESLQAVVYGALSEDDSHVFATGAVIPDGDGPHEWRIRGMATEPGHRGRGAGGAVLDALIAHATVAGATRIWANVRTPAITLYERAGMTVVSEQFDLPEIGPHVVMERRSDAG